MSDPQEEKNDERPTVEGTDPDLGVSGSSGTDEESEDDAEPSASDPVEVEDLP